MNENFSRVYDFGSGVADFSGKDPSKRELKDGVDLAGNVIDLTTSIIDSTPFSEVIKKPIIMLDENMAKLERAKILHAVKAKFSANISRVVAQKMHASTMVKANVFDHVNLSANAHSVHDFMEQTSALYLQTQKSRGYKTRRKLHDQFRIAKKNPQKVVQLPLGLIPDGGITKRIVSGLVYLGEQGAGVRQARKKKEYASGNKTVIKQRIGTKETQRKVLKWQAKDIAELGPKLQRNLYKLKQSIVLLESRESEVNSLRMHGSTIKSGQEAAPILSKLQDRTIDLTMSFHESRHYIDKIVQMCEVMESTVFEARAHMVFLEELLEQTEKTIAANAMVFYK
ncbi:hypothetical protein [Photobacterium swingsii]|uniref:hypothetical protein n=1 Tax=Photobacterium swingsii TaxID=680026 RepID=UPI0040685AB0